MMLDHSLRTLAARMRGRVILPEDVGYDSARAVWNGMIDARPAFIARCAHADDVRLVLEFARVKDLEIAVRGGGHNVSGRSTVDSGVVIDLTEMDTVDVGDDAATAGGGTKWGAFDNATWRHGRATTGGLVSSTGIAGLTLGGGVGWLMRKFGLSCDNLISAELVTSEGDLIVASQWDNADLLWGLRGGGGNFGVATSLSYSVHEIKLVLGGLLAFPLSEAKELIKLYCSLLPDLPDEVTPFINLITLDDGVRAVAVAVCCLDPKGSGEAFVNTFRRLRPPLLDTVKLMTYPQLQKMFDEGCPPGRLNYWKSNYLTGLTDDAIDTVIHFFERVTSPHTTVDIEPYGGAVGRRASDATAFPHRGRELNLLICSMWLPDQPAAPHINWTYDFWNAMLPFASTQAYVNYLDNTADQKVENAYGGNWARLQALKRKYDPDNIFHLNQNIAPG